VNSYKNHEFIPPHGITNMYYHTVSITIATRGNIVIFPSGLGKFPSGQGKYLDISLRTIPTVGLYRKLGEPLA
jgi:hypothetical protein